MTQGWRIRNIATRQLHVGYYLILRAKTSINLLCLYASNFETKSMWIHIPNLTNTIKIFSIVGVPSRGVVQIVIDLMATTFAPGHEITFGNIKFASDPSSNLRLVLNVITNHITFRSPHFCQECDRTTQFRSCSHKVIGFRSNLRDDTITSLAPRG